MLDQAKLLKEAWDMKRKMEKIQKELQKKVVTVSRGSITIHITGGLEVREVVLDPGVEEINNIKLFAANLKNAMNLAISEAKEMMQDELKEVTGGMNLPGLM
ncbi:MAG TPA: YbaB/EbfC family nucleoid-associated protein [Candidatus Wirthbacteria bacterium]|nr:YbaB/EbfC family nucleoid-associated protein [Candidatus Wirthbacteria bacterium]